MNKFTISEEKFEMREVQKFTYLENYGNFLDKLNLHKFLSASLGELCRYNL